MKNKGGFSGGLFDAKRKSTSYPDRNGKWQPRKDNGQYGVHESNKKFSRKGFVAHEFKIGVGEFDFGKVKIELNSSGFSFSAETLGPKASLEINRNLSELSRDSGFDPALINSLRDTLLKSRLHFDMNQVVLKSIDIESPGANVGANLTSNTVGAKASAHLGALKFSLGTPFGVIEAKLKAGFSVGSEIGLAQTKSGKLGITRGQSLSFGLWEFSLSDEQQKQQTPSLFNWHEYNGTNQHFSSMPNDPRLLFTNKTYSSQFDFDALSDMQSPENSKATEPPTEPNIMWDEGPMLDDSTPPDFFSGLEQNDTQFAFNPIPVNASYEDAKNLFKTNAAQFALNDDSMRTMDLLSLEEIKKANQFLSQVYQTQLAILKKMQEQELEREQTIALQELGLGADGFMRFGTEINSPALVTIGKILKTTVIIFQVLNSFKTNEKNEDALGNLFAPLGTLACLGPFGIMLGGILSITNLFSSSTGPSIAEISLSKLNDLLAGQTDILNNLNTLRHEQALMLRTLQQDIAHLKYDLEQRISSVRLEFSEAFDKMHDSLDFIANLTRTTAKTQYLQQLNRYYEQAKSISLKDGRQAQQLTIGLSTVLLSDASNDVLTGLIEHQAKLPLSERLKILLPLFATNNEEETIDQHLHFLLGYFYQEKMINPLIWHQTAQQYVMHTQRFFAFYMDDSDKELMLAIELGKRYDQKMQDFAQADKLQKLLDEYYQSLETVHVKQQQVVQRFNNTRKGYYNQAYTHEGLGSQKIDNLNFFDPIQELLNEFNTLDDSKQTYKHSFQHLKAKAVGQQVNSQQVSIIPYPGKEISEPKKAYWNLGLDMLANKIKELPRTEDPLKSDFGYLLCSEYLKLISLSVSTAAMSYPEIPVAKNKDAPHAREIVQNNRRINAPTSPARYFLAQDNATWECKIRINQLADQTILLLLTQLPQLDKLDELLKDHDLAYALSNHEGQERVYFLRKDPQTMVQLFEVPMAFIASLRKNTVPSAKHRELHPDEAIQLAGYQKESHTLSFTLKGDYSDFNTPISGIEEDDRGYKEPIQPDDSFHKQVRAAIPEYIQQHWRTSHPSQVNIQINQAQLKDKIEQKFKEERALFYSCIISKKADDPSLQQVITEYHASLEILDYSYYSLMAHLHLAGKQFPLGLLNANDILSELKENHTDLSKSDICPKLSTAATLAADKRVQATQLEDKKELSRFHPTCILQGAISLLTAHSFWRNWMRRSYPWLKYRDLHQHWALTIFSNIEKTREELYGYYKDLKSDINGFTQAVSRLNYADSAPITTPMQFQQVYNALHDWALIQAKNPQITNYSRETKDRTALLKQADYQKLKRGWIDNIGFLAQYAADFLDAPVEAAELINVTYWLDGSVYFCKLLDNKTGPYKNSRQLAQDAGIGLETQTSALDRMLQCGYQISEAVTNIAFSEKLFEHLFTAYLNGFEPLRAILNQASSSTDFEIIESLMPDNFTQERCYAGSFLVMKNTLNLAACLIENYTTLAFDQKYHPRLKKSICNGDKLEATLRHLMTKQESKEKSKGLLKKTLDTMELKIASFKNELLKTICFNRSLCYFSLKLEHYFDTKELAQSDTLYITADFMLTGSDHQNRIGFGQAHLDLVDQFLALNPQIKAVMWYGISLDTTLLNHVVLLLANKYPHIDRLGISAANIRLEQLHCFTPILKQLKHLDLRGNRLGGTADDIDSPRFTCFLPFIEETRKTLQYLGLANTSLNALDLAAIQAPFLLIPDEEKDKTFLLDISGNPDCGETDDSVCITIMTSPEGTKEKMKPNPIKTALPVMELAPNYMDFGQRKPGMTIQLLTQTKQLINEYKLEKNNIHSTYARGIYASTN